MTEAIAFHGSVHYQWRATPRTRKASTRDRGKMAASTISASTRHQLARQLTAADGTGQKLDGGCARCTPPRPEADVGFVRTWPTREHRLPDLPFALLQAHSGASHGVWKLVPDTGKMTVSLLQAAWTFAAGQGRLPELPYQGRRRRQLQARRHLGSAPERHHRLDVHMAPYSEAGPASSAPGCHTTIGHRMAGRGVDMRERDAQARLDCTNCHSTVVHDDSSSTTTRRAWPATCATCRRSPRLRRPTCAATGAAGRVQPRDPPVRAGDVMQRNVTPVYKFFNGGRSSTRSGRRPLPQANGRVLMAGPLGSRSEPAPRSPR